MDGLFEQLNRYAGTDHYGFHMPGHKRNTEQFGLPQFYRWDITEIEGFDDLHHAEGILRDGMDQAAKVYGADETHFLVGGSTAGILSAILGGVRKGAKVLVARNCHKSVYHAIFLRELYPVYLYPEADEETLIYGSVTEDMVREKLDGDPEIEAVVLVSPTYEGIVSEIAGIARAAHKKGIPLILDEAHGAHFGFHPDFPKNGNQNGADAVIHSLHKTLPSLTQSALLHLNGELINRERIREYLRIIQSSSPSYLLLGSIDYCVRLLQKEGKGFFASYVDQIKHVRSELETMEQLSLWTHEKQELSKILISTVRTDKSGKDVYESLLRDFHLQVEMAQGDTVLIMTSAGDTEEGLHRLTNALRALDGQVKGRQSQTDRGLWKGISPNPMVYTSSKMIEIADEEEHKSGKSLRRSVCFDQSEGYIAMEYLYLYPPGVPIIVPGERVTKDVIEQIRFQREKGFDIKGTKIKNQIEVWTNG